MTLVDSEVIEANFVDINFVKSLNIESLNRMSKQVKNVDDSIISSKSNDRFYELIFIISTMSQVELITHMFRVVSLTNHRLILRMS